MFYFDRFRNTFKRRSRGTNQNRKHCPIDPYRKTSSGSSSLSSPSETCYGFVRRALQKIAGGGRRVVANSWFLDNWIACMHKQQPLNKRYILYFSKFSLLLYNIIGTTQMGASTVNVQAVIL